MPQGLGNFKHGLSDSPVHHVWRAMIQRCTNPKAQAFANYGGRGITVCDEWRDFAAFIAHMGERPSPAHSLDRIDNERGYEPGNVRWVTREVQNSNRRNSRRYEYRGGLMTLGEAARTAGSRVDTHTARSRVERGWTVADAVEIPFLFRKKQKE